MSERIQFSLCLEISFFSHHIPLSDAFAFNYKDHCIHKMKSNLNLYVFL